MLLDHGTEAQLRSRSSSADSTSWTAPSAVISGSPSASGMPTPSTSAMASTATRSGLFRVPDPEVPGFDPQPSGPGLIRLVPGHRAGDDAGQPLPWVAHRGQLGL